MKSKILMSCMTASVLIAGSVASHAADTNAPAATPPGATSQQGANPAPPHVRPLPGATAGGPMSVLSEEQRASYQKNITDKRAEMLELNSKLQASRQELNEIMYSLKVDEGLIRQKMMNEAKIEADIMVLRARAFADIQPPMTGEQFEKFKEAQQQPRPMMRATPPVSVTPSPGTNQGGAGGAQPKQ
jgi:Spy/CpxP family protein refolding chaperone